MDLSDKVADATENVYTIQPWSNVAPEEVKCSFASYRNNGALAMQLTCRPDGCPEQGFCVPYGIATVNLPESELLPYNVQFIDENNLPGLGQWLEQNGIAYPTGISMPSGYCMYEAYDFVLPERELRRVTDARKHGPDWKPSFKVNHHNFYNGEKMECEISRKRGEAFLKTCLKEIVLSPNLDSLFRLHKEIWHRGVRCMATDADPFGMFRTGSIASMSKDEVHITVPGSGTERLSELIGTDREQDALQIYKDHLVYGITDLLVEVNDNGIDRRAVKDYMAKVNDGMTDIEFKKECLTPFEFIPFSYRENGILKESTVLFWPEENDFLALVKTSWPRQADMDVPAGESAWKSLKDPDRKFTIKTNPHNDSIVVTDHSRRVQQPQKAQGIHM